MSFVLRSPSGEIATTDTRQAADNLIYGLGYRDVTAEYTRPDFLGSLPESEPAVESPTPAPKPPAKSAVKETKERPTSGNVTRSEGSSTPEVGGK